MAENQSNHDLNINWMMITEQIQKFFRNLVLESSHELP